MRGSQFASEVPPRKPDRGGTAVWCSEVGAHRSEPAQDGVAPEPGVGIDPGLLGPRVVVAPAAAAHATLVGGRGRPPVEVPPDALIAILPAAVQSPFPPRLLH